ncbi:MAG: hypothetical protein JWN60_1370 [Acidobacteria bacterium]|jgi:hypothetical protein|nr:hypothetical protein [Acidobacteriota bacterium]
MISEKLNKTPIITLGAINGILLGVFLEILSRSIFLFEVYLRSSSPSPSTITIPEPRYPLNWWYLPLLFFIAVTLATFVVHRFASRYIKSLIWFWQAVGVITSPILALFSIFFTFYYWYLHSFQFTLLYFVKLEIKEGFLVSFIAFPIIAIFNLLFALILKRLKTHLP